MKANLVLNSTLTGKFTCRVCVPTNHRTKCKEDTHSAYYPGAHYTACTRKQNNTKAKARGLGSRSSGSMMDGSWYCVLEICQIVCPVLVEFQKTAAFARLLLAAISSDDMQKLLKLLALTDDVTSSASTIIHALNPRDITSHAAKVVFPTWQPPPSISTEEMTVETHSPVRRVLIW